MVRVNCQNGDGGGLWVADKHFGKSLALQEGYERRRVSPEMRCNWADSTSSLGEESGLGRPDFALLLEAVLLEPAPKV